MNEQRLSSAGELGFRGVLKPDGQLTAPVGIVGKECCHPQCCFCLSHFVDSRTRDGLSALSCQAGQLWRGRHVIYLVALIIFGPKKLPEIGRQIGKLLFEFRRASNDFKMQIEEELRAAEQAERQKEMPRRPLPSHGYPGCYLGR